MSPRSTRRSRRLRRVLLTLPLVLGTALGIAPLAAANPAGCVHETIRADGSVDPRGLCISYGYGRIPGAGDSTPFQNVVGNVEGTGMPIDYYVRSDVARALAAGVARPRGTYMLLFGGAFVCGNRSQLAQQARELARRGYVVVTPEYPLAGALSAYGNYKPNPSYSQESRSVKDANPCDALDQWVKTPEWQEGFLPKLRSVGFEPVLQQSQWVLQRLVRELKTNRSLGADPKRIFALGSSAGGSVALRLGYGGNNDLLADGTDPGDSTIAGALSVSGPSCFPNSKWYGPKIIDGQISPSEMPPCRLDADPSDPPSVMIHEPRGGAEDVFVYSYFMRGGCTAINQVAPGRCLLEDRPISSGGYLEDGTHAYVEWADWLRLFDSLAAQGVGPS